MVLDTLASGPHTSGSFLQSLPMEYKNCLGQDVNTVDTDLFIAHLILAEDIARETIFRGFIRVGRVRLDDEFVVWAVRLR